MAKKVIVSNTARRDLAEILEYISLDSPHSAKKIVRKILKSLKKLPLHPRIGRMIPEIGDLYLREMIVTHYRLMYRLERNKIVLLRVIHGKRLFEGEL